MPVNQDTFGRIFLEIVAQPLFLRRSLLASAHIGALAIKRNNVPATQIEAVVTTARLSGSLAKIMKIAGRSGRVIFVVPQSGARTGLMTPPGLVIAFAEVF